MVSGNDIIHASRTTDMDWRKPTGRKSTGFYDVSSWHALAGMSISEATGFPSHDKCRCMVDPFIRQGILISLHMLNANTIYGLLYNMIYYYIFKLASFIKWITGVS